MKKALPLVALLVVAIFLLLDRTPVQAGLINSQTTMSFSPAQPFMFQQRVTFTVSVTSGAGPAQGRVGLIIDTVQLAELSLDANGRAVFSGGVFEGLHPVRARYKGTGLWKPSDSPVLIIEATKALIGTAISSTNPNIAFGQAIKFTTTLTPIFPSMANVSTITGTVDFYDGSAKLASIPVALGKAIYSTTSLALGTHSVYAQYSGDGDFEASTSYPQAIAVTVS